MKFVHKLLFDSSWAESRRDPVGLLIALTTFGILALELALIRWTSSQIRVFAYFNNIVLICAFLGMGLGVALGRRFPGLVHLAFLALLIVAAPLAFSEPLGLVPMGFPDQSVMLWGAQMNPATLLIFARNMGIFVGLLATIVIVFMCAGAPLGFLFGRTAPLRAYQWDLIGSLMGVVAFTFAAWADAGPVVWLALGSVPFVWLSRRLLTVLAAAGVIWLGHYSVHGALFSPYNRIDLKPDSLAAFQLQVNRDFHQYMLDLSDIRLASGENITSLRELRKLYDLPFTINHQRARAMIVGAGTGNDVQAALRNGYKHVTSVDIDGRIIDLGRTLHPERPYKDTSKVRAVVDDARAFFEKDRDEKFDVVCFGLLDSHAMSSAMSSLRLDNFVYTEEGIRAAWRRVAPGGHLSLAISVFGGPWFFERLYWTIEKATGHVPLAFFSRLHAGVVTYVVATDEAHFVEDIVSAKTQLRPLAKADVTLTTSDDWPFLYLRPGVVPWGYLLVLGSILFFAIVGVRLVFRFGKGEASFDLPLFLMGAAFLLIETRGVTSLSLLFGSTWVVNSVVFGGVLVMVLATNTAVRHWQWSDPRPWFPVLFAATSLLCFFPLAWLHPLPLVLRGIAGGLLTGLPIGIAGIIVPMLLARAKEPAVALGANLLGAVLGGCLEYFSMFGGLRATAMMALVLYLFAYLVFCRRSPVQVEMGVAAAPTPGLSAAN